MQKVENRLILVHSMQGELIFNLFHIFNIGQAIPAVPLENKYSINNNK
jgi:hypothetical protein